MRIHLDEIDLLILETPAISMTASLLSALMKKKIKVIFCDELHNPESELIPYYGSHDTSRAVKQQVAWASDTMDRTWQDIIKRKINKQAQVLSSRGLEEASSMLRNYARNVEPGDLTNREGHAAKVYFNALFGTDFSRDQDNFVNAALNYGYSLILSLFNRAVVAQGCITQLGIKHTNTFNHFNLSSDLMEEFRPFIDYHVLDLMTGEKLSQELLPKHKHAILSWLEKEILVDGQKFRVPHAIRLYTQSVIRLLNDETASPIATVSYV